MTGSPPSAADAGLDGQTILVTGGAGFVGSHLVRALHPENEVRVLDDFSTGRRENVPDGVEVFAGDVREDDLLERAAADVDGICHLAALVSVEESVQDPERTQSINADATLSTLEAARRADARFVLASSAAVYGEPESVPITESHPTEPTSPYGLSKLTADQYARLYTRLYDVPTVALRYFNIYGPGQQGGDYSGVIDVFLERALAGQPIEVHGTGTQTRDFVHVDDVVRATVRAFVTDSVGEAFNVGTGDSTSINQLATVVAECVDSTVEIVHTDPRAGDIEESTASTEKASQQLGFDSEIDLSEGIAELVSHRR
ncbi:Nucleoside-diphosphate-sugar epimerase [Halalkaliarchaeum sp. AArc-CO]|uniref:NAD-dependent epimerase/dehydratase family protein n=1 Tax=Halalkaliarchaeum sp. AArc-CO TaxID=2866381 RepID=UPI00217DCBAF|nr:NAD-dependent epimerase/dehydratase family protein [Halalkaliarchaeum sp. AArc-CO]UWG52057.1 Nucleoside-diphosphate-sugar epimerase [Halalkaliarchaeum sp. AArc-CO]